jgi:phosphoribosylamine--glycine ligase
MKVGIIGSGGREHAICFSLSKSKRIKQIYCFPGNAGTSQIAKNISIDTEDFNKLKNFIVSNKSDLVIVGPEKPLVNGIVDFLEKHNINVFGPNKSASQLEGSKIFTKNLCDKYRIPTAKFGIFKDNKDALHFSNNANYPLVIKADGLASGKGVYICEKKKDSEIAINEIFNGKFGIANNLLIEEFLVGEEMSYFIVTDGKTIKKFGTAQDHKRVLEGDLGKNTGGMGAYSPSRLLNAELEKKIIDRIINPTIKGLKEIGTSYKGFLYIGLMIVKGNPYLIEYNVRMGDPECQTILPKLSSSLLDIFLACCGGKLDQCEIKWHDKKSLCIVVCSKGYPDAFKNNLLIKNLEEIKLNEDEYLYHAGTTRINDEVFSNGGRVLSFVCVSKDFLEARKKIFSLINKLAWKNGFYRKDIGYKVIN